jgi:LacI family transcriptional regulator
MSVTLRDVAARAQVSTATVSRALNGLPVAEATLARVNRVIAELGYAPNLAARALRSDRTMTMGLIFSDLRNMLGVDLLDALSAAIDEAGYTLMIATARGEAERYDTLMRRFMERRVDGLFCVFPSGPAPSLARYREAGTPVLTMFGRGRSFAGQPLFAPTFSQAAADVSAHLRGLGHRRVAVLRSAVRSPPAEAVAAQLTADGVAVIRPEPGDGEGAHALLQRLRAEACTAIVAPDRWGRALADAGVRGDLAVVCVTELSAEPALAQRGLSTLTVDPHRMGRACAAAMLAWLAGDEPPDRTDVQAGVFAARASSSGPS